MTILWKTAWKTVAPILALACLLCVSAVSAQAASNTVKARESYGRGQQLFRQGDFAGAKAAFEAAYEAVPNPIVLLSIAETQVRTEDFGDAVNTLNRYLSERPTAPDRAQVEAQIAKLREKPGFVNVASTPSGAKVFVDGADSGKITPAELGLGVGEHTVALELGGYERAERTVSVEIGSRESVEMTLDATALETEPVVAAPVPVEPAPVDNKRIDNAIWAASGVAAAGLLTGAILGGLALKTKGDFDDKPTEARADKGERLALFADVGFGIAAAGAVTAIVLYVTAKDDAADRAFHVAPRVARNGAGLVGNLRF